MRSFIATAGVALAILSLSSVTLTRDAEAKGCIKGAVVGGVAGHVVHHGLAGAVAGCFVGMHEAHKAAAAARTQHPANNPQNYH